MFIYLIVSAIFFAIGYLVGSNNPLPSVKAKIIQKAKDAAGKL